MPKQLTQSLWKKILCVVTCICLLFSASFIITGCSGSNSSSTKTTKTDGYGREYGKCPSCGKDTPKSTLNYKNMCDSCAAKAKKSLETPR